MAAGGPVEELCDEATCSICLEYFKEPVTIIDCGHNFCQDCLTQFWEEPGTEVSCPYCRKNTQQRNFIPNQQLAKFVALAKRLSFQGGNRTEGKENTICEKHQEPLKLFCKQDQVLICGICNRTKEHRYHRKKSLEKASQKYKDLISEYLRVLKKEREKILAYKAETGRECLSLFKQTDAEREKTIAEFRQLHQFLEEQEALLLAQMEEVETEIATRRDECVARLSRKLSSLDSIIQEMEEKCQHSEIEFLKDIKSTLERCKEYKMFANPVTFPSELKWKIWEFCDINPFLEAIRKKLEDTLSSGFPLQKANVTLDADIASPWLILSTDCKSLRNGREYQHLPNNPERFDEWPCVLGCEGFTEGRHFWQVTVGSEENWAVGVARKSVKRKGQLSISPEEGIWAVGKWAGEYKALNPPDFSRLSLSGEPKRIQVSLNCEGDQVTFLDADRATQLFTFSAVSFPRETLHPFFWLQNKDYLTLS
ncbi:E3 ubiquitin-protein ligase TRIM7-like [Hemicordylus capensis]|uniref:E3 ubiquitin-protein ligase TRIM7-like n=1 Tax=Hemicordylus capensis TaxID=884348 RepID=UPI00230339FB|nr:E3 ubiquitin-protein ligase TRIM7-like [Hemicordylus capensis]